MSSIKLTADSGGGTFEIKAPSSSGNTRVLTIPDSASGTVLTTTNPKSGNIIQVVSTNVTAKSSVVFSNASLANTPCTVTITSAAANSKFLISGSIGGEPNVEDHSVGFVLRRVIGGSGSSIAVGDGSGSRVSISFMQGVGFHGDDQSSTPATSVLSPYLDSPSQAAGTAITYKIDVIGLGQGGTFYFGSSAADSDGTSYERMPNYITVQEIAA